MRRRRRRSEWVGDGLFGNWDMEVIWGIIHDGATRFISITYFMRKLSRHRITEN